MTSTIPLFSLCFEEVLSFHFRLFVKTVFFLPFIDPHLIWATLLIHLENISIHTVRQGKVCDPLISVHSPLSGDFNQSNCLYKIDLQPLVVDVLTTCRWPATSPSPRRSWKVQSCIASSMFSAPFRRGSNLWVQYNIAFHSQRSTSLGLDAHTKKE